MVQLKSISKEGIPEALKKAERYRLLNEPQLSQSICQDILEIEPDNHQAILTLLLSITDQFGDGIPVNSGKANELLTLLADPYERHYYAGIICERRGSALLSRQNINDYFAVYEWLMDAMEHFEKAEALRPPGNDDPILRWNTCVRLIKTHRLQPREEQFTELALE